MFDPATVCIPAIITVAGYVWFSTTELCERLFTLPGRILVGVVLFSAAALYLSDAKAGTADDNYQIRQVVDAQIQAFEKDDSVLAFELLTAAAKWSLKSPKGFRKFMQDKCPVLTKHDPGYLMWGAYTARDEIVQPVLFAIDGVYTAVLFIMSKNPEGQWQIADFTVLQIRIKDA